MRLSRGIVLMVVASLCLATSVVRPQAAAAWTATSLQAVALNEDQFCTYDFETSRALTDGCDWPVTIIFWGNASVARVKQALSSKLPIAGNEMFGFLTDTGRKRVAFEWWGDRGIKSFSFSRALHLRIYGDADGHLTNSSLGDYVIATTHYDLNELSANPVYGYSEQAAAEIETLCAGAFGAGAVAPDSLNLRNPEPDRVEVRPNSRGGFDSHMWQCDGFASLVYVP